MILRDFHANTSGLEQVASIASRQFDILLMKMCEDYDSRSYLIVINPQDCD